MKLLLPLFFALAALAAPASTFSFWFTSPPTQCANTTVQWSGGQPPFTLLLVPVGHLNPETRTIEQINIEQGNQATFPLRFPAQSQFVAVLNDATGIGSGGTSIVTTVSSSSTTSCLNTQPVSPKFTFFLTPSTLASCAPLDISWHSNAEEPIDILGLIPGGESFTIANITDPSSQASQSQAQSDLLEFNWTAVNLRSGTDILIVAGDKDGLGSGGSSDVLSVQPNVGGDMHCISANSPSSTPGNPAGGVYTFVPNPAGGNSGSGSGQTTDNGGAAGASPTPMPSEGSGSGSGSGSGLGSGSNNGLGESGSGNPTAGSGTGNGGGLSSPSTTDAGAGAGSGNTATATGTAGGTGASGGVGSGTETGTGTGGVGTGTDTSATGILNPSQTNDPGSSGGTVTGPPDSSSHNSRLPLILALTLGLLALLALFIGALILYRRHKRSQARQSAYATYPYPRSYGGTRPGRATSRFSFPFSLPISLTLPWTQHENDSESDLLTGPRVNRGSGIGTRMRGGDASVETLGGSMYRTEPFIVPPVHPSHLSDSAHERDRMGLGGGPGYNTDGYFLLPPGAAAATLPRPAMVQRGSSLFLQPTSAAEKGPSRVYANPTPARKGAMPSTTSPGTQTVLAPLLTHNLSTTAGDEHSPAITRAGSRNPFLAMSVPTHNAHNPDHDGRLGLGIATPASPEEESAATAAVIRRASQRSQKGDRVLSSSTGVQGHGYIPPLPPSFTRPIRELRDSEDVGEYDEDGDSQLEAGHGQASIDDPFAIPSTQPRSRASLQRRGAVAHSRGGRGDNVRRSRGSASVRNSHGHGDDDDGPVEIPPTYNSLRRMSLRMSREGFTSPSTALPGNGNVSPTSPTSPMSFMGGGSPTSTSMSHTMHLPLPPSLPLHSLSQQLTPPLPSPAPLYTETDPIPGPEPNIEVGPSLNGETLLRDNQGIRVQDEIPIRAGSGGGGDGGVDVYNRALASTSTGLGSNHNTGVLTFDRYQSLFNPSHALGALGVDGTEVSVPMFSPANATDGHGARADMNQRGFPFDSSLS